MMTFHEAMDLAYEHELCIDFWSCTIVDPDGNEWYWDGSHSQANKENFILTLEEVIEFRKSIEED